MNKKTFTLALFFLIVTIVWLGITLYWLLTGRGCVHVLDLVIAVVFVLAGVGMVCNELKKKRRKHLVEVNRYKIP